MRRPPTLIVLVICALLLTGCLGAVDPDTAAASTETATPTPDTMHGFEVPPCAEKPETLTHENVAEFATQFEAAYDTRRTLQAMRPGVKDQLRSLSPTGARAETANVTRTADGWLVRFSATGTGYSYNRSNETIYADPPLYRVSYYVSDDTVLRSRHSMERTADPRDANINVHCPPE